MQINKKERDTSIFQENRGITIIALIITIIVMLILVVTVINLSSDGNIFYLAKTATDNKRAEMIMENLEIWKANNELNNYLNENDRSEQTMEQLLNELQFQNLITAEERELIENSGEITVGDRTITFKETVQYEKDGLILYCDGINNIVLGHNSNPNIWKDLSGNENDLNLIDVSFDDNSVVLTKTTEQKIYSDKSIDVITVEVVCKPIYKNNDWSYLGQFNKNQQNCIAFQFSKNAMSTGHNKIRYPINLENVNSISVDYSAERVFINGEKTEASIESETWQYNQGYSLLLGDYRQPTLNPYNYNGNIYCIRVYNKQLTEEQIKYNYEIDKKRFNL